MKTTLIGALVLATAGCASYERSWHEDSTRHYRPNDVIYDTSPLYDAYGYESYYYPYASSVSVYYRDVPSYYHWAPYYDPYYVSHAWHLPSHHFGHRPFVFSWYGQRHHRLHDVWWPHFRTPRYRDDSVVHSNRDRRRGRANTRHTAQNEANRLTAPSRSSRRGGVAEFHQGPVLAQPSDARRNERGTATRGRRQTADQPVSVALPTRSATRSSSNDSIRPRSTRRLPQPPRQPSPPGTVRSSEAVASGPTLANTRQPSPPRRVITSAPSRFNGSTTARSRGPGVEQQPRSNAQTMHNPNPRAPATREAARSRSRSIARDRDPARDRATARRSQSETANVKPAPSRRARGTGGSERSATSRPRAPKPASDTPRRVRSTTQRVQERGKRRGSRDELQDR